MKWFVLGAAALVALVAPARADKPGNRPYVQSGPDGALYARCVPDATTGSAGRTRVYSVGRDKDDLLETYDWYAQDGVTLGWSPTAGRVAVMARRNGAELSFYLGGKLLASYTAEELGKFGVEVARRRVPLPEGAEFRVVGCEQVPGTNDYDFVIESKGKRLTFDIVTGKPRSAERADLRGPGGRDEGAGGDPGTRGRAGGSGAGEKTPVAIGDWSEPAGGLRGRLLVSRGRVLGDGKARETLVYVELQNVADAGEQSVYFDPDALACELTDAAGKAVRPSPGGGSGGRPGKTWVTIPFDGSIRLRANPYGFGRAEGLLIPLNNTAWHITGDAEYHLSGTLTVTPPEGKADAWKGELKLPKAKVSLK
jgi:hypothetical protein